MTIFERARIAISRGTDGADRKPAVAQIPPATTDTNSLRKSVEALRSVIATREGTSGSPLDQHLTLRDLLDGGLMQLQMPNGRVYGPGPTPGSGVIAASTDPRPILLIPPPPTNLQVAGAFTNVIITWDLLDFQNFSFTEVWRFTSDAIGSATKIGASTARIYVDETAVLGTGYFYWARAVGVSSSGALVYGPFNATAGVPGGRLFVGGTDISALTIQAGNLANGSITATKVATGAIGLTAFAAGLTPVEIVGALPTTGNTDGRTVFLTSDKKLYRYSSTASAFIRSVDGADIVANSITAGSIAAGAIGASQIAAGAVTTSKLTVADFTTFIAYPKGDSNEQWSLSGAIPYPDTVGSVSFWPTASNSTYANRFRLRDNYAGRPFAVIPGDQFFCSMDTMSEGSGASVYSFSIGLAFLDTTGTLFYWAAGATRAVGTSGFAAVSGSLTVPAGATNAYVWMQIDGPGGTDFVGLAGKAHYATNMQVRRMNSANLIVDGAITANKIAVNAIAVGTAAIQNGAIVNAMIANLAVDNAKIVNLDGAKINAASITATQVAANSLTAANINANGLIIRDNSGTAILGVGYGLPLSYVPAGALNSNVLVGGHNLLSDSNNFLLNTFNGGSVVTSTGQTDQYGGLTATLLTLAGVSGDCYRRTAGTFRAGATYTCSVWVKLGSATNICLVATDGSAWNTGGGVVSTTAGWQRLSVQITPSGSNIDLVIGGHSQSGLAAQSAGTVYTCNMQIEEGNTATQWNPAPGDFQTSLNDKLSKSTPSILASTVSINATAGAGFVAGSLTWDAAGNRTGGSGIAMTPGGLLGVNSSGATTFSINASTGNATFAGTLAANIVNTSQIVAGAATSLTPGSATARTVGASTAGTYTIVSQSVTTSGAALVIQLYTEYSYDTGLIGLAAVNGSFTTRLKRGSTVLWSSTVVGNQYDNGTSFGLRDARSYSPIYVETPAAGTYTYSVELTYTCDQPAGPAISASYIVLTEIKR